MSQPRRATNGAQQSVNVSYACSSYQNNGKITSQTDNISGEQVQYTYDALNRLATAEATSSSWGQSYSYDGFGTLTGQNIIAGSAPTYSATPSPTTNRVGCTDANGNSNEINACGVGGYVYDVENRFDGDLIMAGTRAPGSYGYGYAPGNKRVSRAVCCSSDFNGNTTVSTDEVVYWSVGGQKLAAYQIGGYGTLVSFPPSAPPLTATQTGTWYYFGSKMLKNAGGYVVADRLGSIGHFYPYGQEKSSATQNGTEKFTGYLRDAETGMDYADQRYHVPGTGRFLTPDLWPTGAPNAVIFPENWNRYAYVGGDPVERTDPSGLCSPQDNPPCYSVTGTGSQPSGPTVIQLPTEYNGYQGACSDPGPVFDYTDCVSTYTPPPPPDYAFLNGQCYAQVHDSGQQVLNSGMNSINEFFSLGSSLEAGISKGVLVGLLEGAIGEFEADGAAAGWGGALFGGLVGGVLGGSAAIITGPVVNSVARKFLGTHFGEKVALSTLQSVVNQLTTYYQGQCDKLYPSGGPIASTPAP